ncbi:hypothetical protein L7F22_049735 [Adiantum nelumboides]|nr:hypothetical protein [Adiantum nelumboides]
MANSSLSPALDNAISACRTSEAAVAPSANYHCTRASPAAAKDDEGLRLWAALEKLPTFSRLRKGFLQHVSPAGAVIHEQVDDVAKLGYSEKRQLLDKLLHDVDEDNELFLCKLRERIDRMTQFVPQTTSAYISQHDTQYGMMTVRETLNFSGRCQGVGTRYEMLAELCRREKAAGIKPDTDIDVFMKLFVLSIIVMTVFFRTNLDTNSVEDGVLYMGALFYGQLIIMFVGMADMVMVVNRLPVFYKQRDQLLYPAWAFSIPVVMIRIPLSIFESLIWVCLTYFGIGFALEADSLNWQHAALSKPQAILPEKKANEQSSRRFKRPQEKQEPQPRVNEVSYQPEGSDSPSKIHAPMISKHTSDIENGTDVQRKGMVLPFQPLSIAFNSINYFVDMPAEMKKQGIEKDRLQLLQDVSGAFRPTVLTALVGVSGAGKTTLMDVLAGRKTSGYTEGTISISGYPKNQETFARIAGYCEQNDIHSPNVTVKESLVYSAWLRLPSEIDKHTKEMFVDEVMELVELTPIADALVGLPNVNGLSTEQRKRLTIAVELVANPSIIFLDEPTSGLDARAAAIVMRTVRNTVDTGRTVVCTIHQPSIDIFESFDELLLLKTGGQVIYAGPLGHRSCKLIEYFQGIPGTVPIIDGCNPATWMLDISSPSAEARLQVDFAQIYHNSPLYQCTEALIKELSTPRPGSKDLYFPMQYPQNFPEQCKACLWKQHRSYWRNPHYNAVRFLFTVAIALLVGTVFWRSGKQMETTSDLYNIVGGVYAISLFLAFHNVTTVQPVVAIERTVFYRERGARMYSAVSYAFAQPTADYLCPDTDQDKNDFKVFEPNSSHSFENAGPIN